MCELEKKKREQSEMMGKLAPVNVQKGKIINTNNTNNTNNKISCKNL